MPSRTCYSWARRRFCDFGCLTCAVHDSARNCGSVGKQDELTAVSINDIERSSVNSTYLGIVYTTCIHAGVHYVFFYSAFRYWSPRVYNISVFTCCSTTHGRQQRMEKNADPFAHVSRLTPEARLRPVVVAPNQPSMRPRNAGSFSKKGR